MMHASHLDGIPRRPFALPAWVMSLVFHAALLLLLALGVRAAPPPAAEAEPQRSVGIVLARRAAPQERTYFDPQDAKDPSVASAPAAASSASSVAQEALPGEGQAPALEASLALPSADRAEAAALHALADVALASRGRVGLGTRDGEEAIIAADLAAQRGRGGPVGPPTQVSLFGSSPAQGHSFVFVIDRSQSMGDAGLGMLRAAETELEHALAPLRTNHKFQIIAYNKTPLAFQARGLASADDAAKRQALEFLRNLVALGGTGHLTALLAALRLEPDVVFLLTDGGDPPLTNPDVDEVVRRAKGRTRVTCLQFGFGASLHEGDTLRRLAERTGGSYAYIDMSRRR